MTEQPDLIDIPLVHQGFFVDRTKLPTKKQLEKNGGYDHGEIERAFMEEWAEIQKDGQYALNFFIAQAAKTGRLPKGFGPATATQRDAWIVADIIQWLGTNCGLSFLGIVFSRAGYRFTYEALANSQKKWNRIQKRRQTIERKKQEKKNRPVKRKFGDL